ncbi:MAG: hypothetical protein EBX41_04075, partial [Chitinophagia bacterium]|nr:hypothetical protein [Chitinophagia bacterium]
MKFFLHFRYLLALPVLLWISSCSEKFNVAAPYKNITVIYGLLDRADTAHYIRIQKAYLDESISALVMAKNADSNFYKSLNVWVEEQTLQGSTISKIPLTRVAIDSEGYEKPEGTFFTTPNYAYKFKNLLNPSSIYKLVVYNAATGETDSALSPVIDDINNTMFYINYIDDTSKNRKGLEFASTNPYQTIEIQGRYLPPANFQFNGYTTPVGLVQGFIRIRWTDSNNVDNSLTPRYYDYNLGYTGVSASSFAYSVKNIDLHTAINSGMGIAPEHVYRLIDRFEINLYLGTYDFNTYLQVAAVQGTGLTGTEVQPTYTNIK